MSIVKLNRNPVHLNVLQSQEFLFIDKSGQVSAELISTLEIILMGLRGNSIPFGDVLIVCTLYHNQLEPVKGKTFLVSSHILSCFKMVRLQHYVHA